MENKETVLSVKNLRINFSTDNGYVQAVRGVSFDLHRGETLCIVGESGSGKSVTNKAIMGILSKNGRIVDGSIMYEGEDLTKIGEDEFHRIRGHKIGMIFQDPLSSLNPIVRIGKQITEAMLINGSKTKKMYEELVASSLTAYRNAQTELKTGLAQGSEKIKFLKAEKKKNIILAKNEVSNEYNGRLYSNKQALGAAIFDLNSKKFEDIKRLEDNFWAQFDAKNQPKDEELEKLKVEKATVTFETNLKIKSLKEEYKKTKAEIKEQKSILISNCKDKINQITKDFDNKISEAKTEYKENKPILIEKYSQIINKTKAAFKVDSCNAKVKVKEFKKEQKEEYKNKKVSIKSRTGVASKRSIKKALKENKREYISKLRITKAEAKAKAIQIMEEVGIKDPEKRFKQYPFEFSGGMRQRIVIAIALTADPDILICDEPTTALDVTIQAQILELINRLKRERNLSCIFITHDLGVVANMADRVAVMYAGKIVEFGKEEEIFYDPKHPYTWALLASIPDIDSNEKLDAIPGTPPNMIYPPVGDAFALRSKYAMSIDFKKEPPFFKVSDTHYAATWLLDPRAPKVEMPAIVKSRIENSLKANKKGGNK